MNMKVTQREERKKSFLPIFIYLFFLVYVTSLTSLDRI